MYTIGNDEGEAPMFEVENGAISLAGIRETNFNNNPYLNVVRETRGSVTRTLVNGQSNEGINGSGFTLFVGYALGSGNTAPAVSAGENVSIVLPNNTVTFDAFVNDDGLPQSSCFTSLSWIQTSGPGGATIANSDTKKPTITFTNAGVYTFSLTANDGAASTTDEINVYVFDQSLTTAAGNGADAPIYSGGGANNNNYGAAQNLPVRRASNVFSRKAYLRFDVSSLQQNIEGAQLAIEISTVNTRLIQDWTYNVFGLVELASYGQGKLNENWVEGQKDGEVAVNEEINWNNAPGNINSGGGPYDPTTNTGGGVNNVQTVFLGNLVSRSGNREILRLNSSQLKEFINEDTNGIVTLIITRVNTSGNVNSFASKEHTSLAAPTLNVVFEPATSPDPIEGLTTRYWRLQNKATGQWVQPLACVGNSGTRLVVSPQSNTGDCTMFQFNKAANGYYFIVNKATGGRLKFENDDATADDSVPVVLVGHTFTGPNPQWQLIEAGNGYFRLQNRVTGNWIRSKGCSINENTLITQVSTNFTGNCTRWKLVDAGAVSSRAQALDVAEANQVVVYPNPAQNHITVSGAPQDVESMVIYSLQGKAMQTHVVKNTGQSPVTLSTQSLPPGLYVLSLQYATKPNQNIRFAIAQ